MHITHSMLDITREQAQKYILSKQGLITTEPAKSVLEVANGIHNIQIDTISVVARSHDLTVYNRFTEYREKDIWNNLKKKELFEYYSHALCLMPIEQYPFYKWRMDEYFSSEKKTTWEKWFIVNESVLDLVLNRIKQEGALSSKDFKVPEERKSQGWFNWKKEKRALEYLFYSGKLMISHRIGFQKYYDLPERVLPAHISNESMSITDIPDYLVKVIFSSIGLGGIEEFRNYIKSKAIKLIWKGKTESIENFLEKNVSEGVLIKVKIDEIDQIQYALASNVKELRNSKEVKMHYTKLINPFDNVARDRKLLKKIWNYDYKLEAYTPPPQRIFGYYLMPLLDGHQFIGRLEPKAHRKDKVLEIRSLYFEDWFIPLEGNFERIALGLQKFAAFHQCDTVVIGDKFPKKYKSQLKNHLD